jgi:cell wall-associated NlpC family hydrolase
MRHVLTRLAALAALTAACAVPATQAFAEPHPADGTSRAAARLHTAPDAVREHNRLAARAALRLARRIPTVGERVVGIARRYLGAPYAYGGAGPGGFDCSGFVMYVYGKVGIELPHHAASQYGLGRAVPYAQLEAGDLVFFSGLGHVGIYVGGGRFVDAPQTGDVVRVRPLAERRDSFVGARRIVAA